jgi:hypothetical protein
MVVVVEKEACDRIVAVPGATAFSAVAATRLSAWSDDVLRSGAYACRRAVWWCAGVERLEGERGQGGGR